MVMNQDPKRPKCPPPFIRPIPQGPCILPGFVTPFGGPASGISPLGGPVGVLPSSGCTPSNFFADCFQECVGQITAASPGPICGWTFSEVFGTSTTPIIFTPGSMTITTDTATDYIGAVKSLPRPLPQNLSISAQFEFTEYQTPPNPTTTYQLFLTSPDSSRGIFLSLFGDGNGVIQVGDVLLIPAWIFTWTPNLGHHIVHLSIDSRGVPRIWIDHQEIPVTFFGDIFSIFDQLPGNTISFFGGAGENAPAASPISRVFLMEGNASQETNFCCP